MIRTPGPQSIPDLLFSALASKRRRGFAGFAGAGRATQTSQCVSVIVEPLGLFSKCPPEYVISVVVFCESVCGLGRFVFAGAADKSAKPNSWKEKVYFHICFWSEFKFMQMFWRFRYCFLRGIYAFLLFVYAPCVRKIRLSLRAGSLRTAAGITGAGLCLSCSALCPLGVHKAKDHSTATQRPPPTQHTRARARA